MNEASGPEGTATSRAPGPSGRPRVASRLMPTWASHYERAWLAGDVVAGLTVAVLLVPQAMAYASLAGMPPITGLYASLAALVVYALVGRSSHLSFGPVAIVGLLTATAIGPLADGDPARIAALSGALALMVGILHLVLAAARAGAVVDLISHPVIVGFTAAAGFVIGLTQMRDLLGLDIPRSERASEAVVSVVGAIGEVHPATMVVGLTALAALLLVRRLSPRLPGVLAVVAVSIVVSIVVDLPARGVRIVGDIPSGLPRVSLPLIGLDDLAMLVPAALVIALISFAESISIGKAIAGRSREFLVADRELVASGLANAAAGLVGGFPVAGSFTRSYLTYQARARTQLAGIVAAVVIVLTLVLLTPVLQPLPRAVLAAIVVVTVIGLVDVKEAVHIAKVDRNDGIVLGVAFVSTLALGVELGLAAGIVANLLVYVAGRMRPRLVVLGRVAGTRHYRNVERHMTMTSPRGIMLRLDGELDFLSATAISSHLRRLAAQDPDLEWIVLDASSVAHLDTTGVHALRDVQRQLAEAAVDLHLVALHGPQRDVLHRAGLWDDLIAVRCHRSIAAALEAVGVDDDDPLVLPQPGEVAPDRLV